MDSLLKMLHLAMMDITKKKTGQRQDWSVINAQLSVYFAGRMPDQNRLLLDMKRHALLYINQRLTAH